MIQRTEVDGVPTCVLPSSGPLAAGLVFRVGRADESLPMAGLTRLVAYLAGDAQAQASYATECESGLVTTTFAVRGSATDLQRFLDGIVAALAQPPLDRLATARAVLAGRGDADPMAALLRRRYGAAGYGLAGFAPLGIPVATPEAVTEWAGSRFSRGNAVLWISGELPAGLRLRLPGGPSRPLPPAEAVLPAGPSWFADDVTTLRYDALLPHSPAARAYAQVMHRELQRTLRQDMAVSYSPGVAYLNRRDGSARLLAQVDVLPAQREAALRGFLAALDRVAGGTVDPSDVAALRSRAEKPVTGSGAERGRLVSYALDVLCGQPPEEAEPVLAPSTGDIVAVARDAVPTGLLQVPAGLREVPGFTELSALSKGAARKGDRIRTRHKSDDRLVLGAEAVTACGPDGERTVRLSECAALVVWPDGDRHLIDRDGTTIAVDPAHWRISEEQLRRLNAAVPADVVVTMPAMPGVPAARRKRGWWRGN
jgi:zinc protease